MTSPSSLEKLFGPDFRTRLSAFLDEARVALRSDVIAVSELGAAHGHLESVWRYWSPVSVEPGSLAFEQFRSLAVGAPSADARNAALGALGMAADCQASILPLDFMPRFAAFPDTLLVEAGRHSIDASLLSELEVTLKAALSRYRRDQLAHAVFKAVEQAPDAIELTDSRAQLLYANPAWERVFGHSLSEVAGQTVGRLFRDPVSPLHDAAFYQFTLAKLAEGHPWLGALACRARDGRRVFCEVSVSPFSADDEGLRGNFAIRRDLSNRAERDEALAKVHHEFRSVLSAIPDGVAVLRDGKIYFANAAFLAMVGLTEAEAIGRTYVEFVHPDDRVQFLQNYEHGMTGVRVLRKDSSPRFAEISAAGAVSFEGKPAMILLSRDTTDHRLAQEQLSRAEKLSALGSLAAGVAHEINNPLAYVGMNLKYIRKSEALSAPSMDALDEAIEGAERIRRIVLELRGYSGSEGPGPPEPVDVTKAITSAINIAQNEIRHRARLERRLGDELHVLGREGQLVQVFVNVLVNSAQAIPSFDREEHVISIASESPADDCVEVRIADTGVGISASALPHVFDPFATAKRRGDGSGLGLAISKRIVEEFGGRIAVESTVGKGTTVTISLQRVAPRRPTVRVPPRVSGAMPRVEPVRARVLVVDDDVPVARGIKRMLPGHEVTIARDAEEGLTALDANPEFDLILCDLMMPGTPGPAFYAEACRRYPSLERRFIFMTGGAFADWARQFLETVESPVLMKPFDVSVVLEFLQGFAQAGRARSTG